jgi:hypothetical protein
LAFFLAPAEERQKRFPERVAPRPGVADTLVEINDEQRRGWFLSYSVRL